MNKSSSQRKVRIAFQLSLTLRSNTLTIIAMNSSPSMTFLETCRTHIDSFVSDVRAKGINFQICQESRNRWPKPDSEFDFGTWVNGFLQEQPHLLDMKQTRYLICDQYLVGKFLSEYGWTYIQNINLHDRRLYGHTEGESLQILHAIHDTKYWPSEPTPGFLSLAGIMGLEEGEITSLKRQLVASELREAALRIQLEEAKDTIVSIASLVANS